MFEVSVEETFAAAHQLRNYKGKVSGEKLNSTGRVTDLIKTDRRVLALLDHRITRQRYGQIFFDSLPDYGFSTGRKDVERFFDV